MLKLILIDIDCISRNSHRMRGKMLVLSDKQIEFNSGKLDFCSEIKEISGVDINMCWQCKTCTNGCHVAHAMD